MFRADLLHPAGAIPAALVCICTALLRHLINPTDMHQVARTQRKGKDSNMAAIKRFIGGLPAELSAFAGVEAVAVVRVDSAPRPSP